MKRKAYLNVITTLGLSVSPQMLRELQVAVERKEECVSRWKIGILLRPFKFQNVKDSLDYSCEDTLSHALSCTWYNAGAERFKIPQSHACCLIIDSVVGDGRYSRSNCCQPMIRKIGRAHV